MGAPLPLARIEAGEGGRPLLLVHGFTGAKEDFADHLPRLAADGWHVVAPDLRGHGASPAPASGYGFDTMALDVVGVADELGWERFSLLGHSMGGMVVQEAAIESQHRLDALVLMNTTHGAVAIDPALATLAVEVVRGAGMAGLLAAQKALGGGPFTSEAAARLRARRPDWDAYADSRLLASSPLMYVEAVGLMLAAPSRLDRLRQLRVPTLVMVGDQDRTFMTGCEELAAAIPGASLVVVPGAGHSPHVEEPEVWYDALQSFLRAL
ncbi:MAG: alpha/beta fold hydrolase [Acidobacteria bacterium]|nr:alpha/beta fold hydrolase [Acidobacteriota bacterium]